MQPGRFVDVGSGLRYFGAAVAFGFAAVWIMATLAAALICLLAAAAGFGSVAVAQRVRTKLASRAENHAASKSAELAVSSWRPPEDDSPPSPDELNRDLGYVYEPGAATYPAVAEEEHGWPPDDDGVTRSGTPL
jgi:hypothetical protein